MVDPSFLRGVAAELFPSPLEAVAVGLGVANIVLLVRRSIWNFPAGIAMVTLYAWVFFHAHLYSDTLLQGFFLVVQIIGWVAWLRHREPAGDVIVVRSTVRELTFSLMGTVVGAVMLGTLMHRYTPAAFPYIDATSTALSVTAQLLLTWRRLENWLWWIAANVIQIAMYWVKHLRPTSALYIFFLVMSTLGYVQWRRNFRRQANAGTSAP
jgi:nicotinamide mononucleotide transporter